MWLFSTWNRLYACFLQDVIIFVKIIAFTPRYLRYGTERLQKWNEKSIDKKDRIWYDEKNARKVDYNNLCRIMNFVKMQQPTDEMVKYVCEIFNEYVDVLREEPILLKDSLQSRYSDAFIVDADIEKSDIIVSPSDLNAYFS